MHRVDASLAVALWCALAGAPRPLAAQSARNVASLAGVEGVEVVVEELTAAQRNLGLSESALRNDVVTRLRQAGVRVVAQSVACGESPCLYVHVTTTVGDGANAHFVHVGVQQMVNLSRDTAFALSVETWRAVGRIGLAPGRETAERVRDAVRSEVDQFVTAYLDANPRR